jgi:hypothetical protein
MPKKTDKTIEPIDAKFEDVAKKMIQPAGGKPSDNKELSGKSELQPALSYQYTLDLDIQVEKTVDGLEMGILDNGIPYLTQEGLASACGVARSVIYDISQDWVKNFDNDVLGKDRNSFIKEYLFTNGYKDPSLYIETTTKSGVTHYSYPDIVCMAIIEYYAFESRSKNETAIKHYRKFAKFGLQKFIYEALHYIPEDNWKYYNDRVSILKDSSPDGYFIVFNEITGLIVDLINASLTVNHKTIPDISVGLAWGKYWDAQKLNKKFGERTKYEHNYPLYYPQAESNPQKPWAYPDASLPEFRRWFRHEYLLSKFPKYILTKANVLNGGKNEAQKIASMYNPSQIEGS